MNPSDYLEALRARVKPKHVSYDAIDATFLAIKNIVDQYLRERKLTEQK